MGLVNTASLAVDLSMESADLTKNMLCDVATQRK